MADATPAAPTATVYCYNGNTWPDFDPNLTPDQVKELLASYYPEIINATTREETKDGTRKVTFEKLVGTKGAAPALPHTPADAALALLRDLHARANRCLAIAALDNNSNETYDADATTLITYIDEQAGRLLGLSRDESFAVYAEQRAAVAAELDLDPLGEFHHDEDSITPDDVAREEYAERTAR